MTVEALVRGVTTVDLRERRLDEEQLRGLSAPDLVRHALAQARLLVRAEILHAKRELQAEVAAAKRTGVILGIALALALCALSALAVAVGLAMPLPHVWAVAVVGGVTLASAGVLALLGVRQLPKRPLPRTQDRLKRDMALLKEELP
jgi:hypothetical protein